MSSVTEIQLYKVRAHFPARIIPALSGGMQFVYIIGTNRVGIGTHTLFNCSSVTD